MEKTQLCQGWKMRCVKDNEWQQAVIPGSVYTDLLRNGNMEDPFWKDNEMSACERMKEDYEYECTFIPEKTVLGEEKQFLHFDGLDTITTVSLNGEILGETISMHREWEFDVTDKLKEGENVLHILFHSPLKYIEEAYKKYGNIGRCHGRIHAHPKSALYVRMGLGRTSSGCRNLPPGMAVRCDIRKSGQCVCDTGTHGKYSDFTLCGRSCIYRKHICRNYL